MNEEQNKKNQAKTKGVKAKLYQKWWFWLCIVLIVLILAFIIIMAMGFKMVTSGINQVAFDVQQIDNDATLYSSAGGNTVIVEIPNYTDDTKKDKKDSIIETIRNYASEGQILNTYSKFILITKIPSDDDKKDYFISSTVYELPSMNEITDESKIYIDFVEFTKKSLSGSTNTSSTNTSNSTTSTTNTNSAQNNSTSYNSTNTSSSKSNTSTSTTPSSTTTIGERNALSKAKSYLEFMAFSYSGLVEQLEYEGFSSSEAKYGADNCGADWNEQAAKKAKSYINTMSFSRSGLIEQLEYEGFTKEQAEYGVSSVGY